MSSSRVLARLCGCALLAACDAGVTSIGAWSPVRDAGREDAGKRRDGGVRDGGVQPTGRYIEAEDGALSGGFTIDADARASRGQGIAPPADVVSDDAPGSALARYDLQLDRAGEYVIWGRIHAPGPSNNRFWFQLDGGDWHKWRISTGEIWYWDDFHDDADYGTPLRFELEPGAHELVIANCVPGVWLDRLYVTADGDEPPGNDTPCSPPHSIQLDGACLPSCGVLQGTECGPVACEGRELLPAYDCDVCCHVGP